MGVAARRIAGASVLAMCLAAAAWLDVGPLPLPPAPGVEADAASYRRDPAFTCTLPSPSSMKAYPSCTGDVNYAGNGLDLRFTPWTAGEPIVYGGIPSDATSVEITVEGRRTVVRRWRTRRPVGLEIEMPHQLLAVVSPGPAPRLVLRALCADPAACDRAEAILRTVRFLD
jgi:hypothetical protein